MSKKLLALVLFLTVAACRAQTVNVYANHFGGFNPATGTIYFQPVSPSGNPTAYALTGYGQIPSTAVTATVIRGVFSLTLADTTLTNPLNLCFKAYFQTGSGAMQSLGPGYTCVQPAGNNYWCSSSQCNFDNYSPNLPPVGTIDQGVWNINNAIGPITFTGSGVSQSGSTFTFNGGGGGGSIGDSDITNQYISQPTTTIVSSLPSSGKYRISYYLNQNALCTTGSQFVQLAFQWTDAQNSRAVTSIILMLGSSESPNLGSVQGIIPIYAAASTAVTYTSAVYGACAVGGPASYDAHIAVESIQ